MPTKTLNLNAFAKELGDYGKHTLEKQKAAARNGMLKSIPDLVKASPVDTGKYASSWEFSETEVSAILGNTAPHAVIIENGARPFTPPIGPLLQWGKRVLKDSTQPPNYSPQVWALAKSVQAKITREGIKPKHILENALPTIIANIKEEFEKLD